MPIHSYYIVKLQGSGKLINTSSNSFTYKEVLSIGKTVQVLHNGVNKNATVVFGGDRVECFVKKTELERVSSPARMNQANVIDHIKQAHSNLCLGKDVPKRSLNFESVTVVSPLKTRSGKVLRRPVALPALENPASSNINDGDSDATVFDDDDDRESEKFVGKTMAAEHVITCEEKEVDPCEKPAKELGVSNNIPIPAGGGLSNTSGSQEAASSNVDPRDKPAKELGVSNNIPIPAGGGLSNTSGSQEAASSNVDPRDKPAKELGVSNNIPIPAGGGLSNTSGSQEAASSNVDPRDKPAKELGVSNNIPIPAGGGLSNTSGSQEAASSNVDPRDKPAKELGVSNNIPIPAGGGLSNTSGSQEAASSNAKRADSRHLKITPKEAKTQGDMLFDSENEQSEESEDLPLSESEYCEESETESEESLEEQNQEEITIPTKTSTSKVGVKKAKEDCLVIALVVLHDVGPKALKIECSSLCPKNYIYLLKGPDSLKSPNALFTHLTSVSNKNKSIEMNYIELAVAKGTVPLIFEDTGRIPHVKLILKSPEEFFYEGIALNRTCFLGFHIKIGDGNIHKEIQRITLSRGCSVLMKTVLKVLFTHEADEEKCVVLGSINVPKTIAALSKNKDSVVNPALKFSTVDDGRADEFCPYCDDDRPIKKLRTHLLSSVHAQEPEILLWHKSETVEAKRTILSSLRLRGYAKHNALACNEGGKVFPKKRSKSDKRDCVVCSNCGGVFSKTSFKAHAKKCIDGAAALEEEDKLLPAGIKVDTLQLAGNCSLEFIQMYKDCLKALRDGGEIVNFVMSDEVASLTLQTIFYQQSNKNTGLQTVRNKSRLLYSIHLHCKTNVDGYKCVSDLVNPALLLDDLLSCVRDLVGYDPNTKYFKDDTKVMNINSLLKVIGNTASTIALRHKDKEKEMQANLFTNMLSQEFWKARTVGLASQHRAISKPKDLKQVNAEDLQMFGVFLESRMSDCYDNCLQDVSEEDSEFRMQFRQLRGYLGVRLSSFSARRLGETQHALSKDWTERPHPLNENSRALLSKKQEEVADSFEIFYVNGKNAQQLPILVKKKWTKYLDYISNETNRLRGGISNSQFLFGGTGKTGFLDLFKVLREAASKCGASDPDALRSKPIRRSLATSLGTLNLSYTSKELLCRHMGHNAKVHESYYHLPPALSFLVTMGLSCSLFEDNAVQNVRGKSLEELMNVENKTQEDPLCVQAACPDLGIELDQESDEDDDYEKIQKKQENLKESRIKVLKNAKKKPGKTRNSEPGSKRISKESAKKLAGKKAKNRCSPDRTASKKLPKKIKVGKKKSGSDDQSLGRPCPQKITKEDDLRRKKTCGLKRNQSVNRLDNSQCAPDQSSQRVAVKRKANFASEVNGRTSRMKRIVKTSERSSVGTKLNREIQTAIMEHFAVNVKSQSLPSNRDFEVMKRRHPILKRATNIAIKQYLTCYYDKNS